MDILFSIVVLGMAIMAIYRLYQMVKSRPEQFTSANLSKSALVTAILALALIGFVALLVLLVRTS